MFIVVIAIDACAGVQGMYVCEFKIQLLFCRLIRPTPCRISSGEEETQSEGSYLDHVSLNIHSIARRF
jgi:hypothetical protein